MSKREIKKIKIQKYEKNVYIKEYRDSNKNSKILWKNNITKI